jgi:hypothetical protein
MLNIFTGHVTHGSCSQDAQCASRQHQPQCSCATGPWEHLEYNMRHRNIRLRACSCAHTQTHRHIRANKGVHARLPQQAKSRGAALSEGPVNTTVQAQQAGRGEALVQNRNNTSPRREKTKLGASSKFGIHCHHAILWQAARCLCVPRVTGRQAEPFAPSVCWHGRWCICRVGQ